MSAVDDFREAAKVLRERAEAAPKGPWSVEYFGDNGYPQRVTNAQETLIATTHEGGTGLRPTPEYIRLMHPLVGLALADTFAALAKAARFGDDIMGRVGYGEALAVARLILDSAR